MAANTTLVRELISADTMIEVRAGEDTIRFGPEGALIEQTAPGPWTDTVEITFWVGPAMATLVLPADTTVVATRG